MELKITHEGISPIREVLPLVSHNDPILSKRMIEFDFRKNDAVDIANQLIEAMKKYGGLGLSANQIGLKHRVFVMGVDDQIVAYFNPEIINVGGEVIKMEEGCLSYPNLFLNVPRFKSIQVEYQDYTGTKHEKTFEGMTAGIFQHEFDHLFGINFTQRVGKTSLMMGKSRQKKYEKKMERIKK